MTCVSVNIIFVLLLFLTCSILALNTQNDTDQNPAKNDTAAPESRTAKFLRRDSNAENHRYDVDRKDFNVNFARNHLHRPHKRQRPKEIQSYQYEEFGNHNNNNNNNKNGQIGYEKYLNHPLLGNLGNVFDKDEIRDLFLSTGYDYNKLVKDYNAKLAKDKFKSEINNAGSQDGSHEIPHHNKNTDNDYDFSETSNVDDSREVYEKKDRTPQFTPIVNDKLKNGGKVKNYPTNSYGELINGWNDPTEGVVKPGDDGKIFSQEINDFLSDGYGSDKNPFQNFEPSFPANYDSKYNFDAKPGSDLKSTTYSITDWNGKITNNDYVSEFDFKGNPISPSDDTGFKGYSGKVTDFAFDAAKDFPFNKIKDNVFDKPKNSNKNNDFTFKPATDPFDKTKEFSFSAPKDNPFDNNKGFGTIKDYSFDKTKDFSFGSTKDYSPEKPQDFSTFGSTKDFNSNNDNIYSFGSTKDYSDKSKDFTFGSTNDFTLNKDNIHSFGPTKDYPFDTKPNDFSFGPTKGYHLDNFKDFGTQTESPFNNFKDVSYLDRPKDLSFDSVRDHSFDKGEDYTPVTPKTYNGFEIFNPSLNNVNQTTNFFDFDQNFASSFDHKTTTLRSEPFDFSDAFRKLNPNDYYYHQHRDLHYPVNQDIPISTASTPTLVSSSEVKILRFVNPDKDTYTGKRNSWKLNFKCPSKI